LQRSNFKNTHGFKTHSFKKYIIIENITWKEIEVMYIYYPN